MSSRRRLREWILQILYQSDLQGAGVLNLLPRFLETIHASEEDQAFINDACRELSELLDSVDAEIGRHATRWTLPRMAAVDRNILRLAAFEILHRPDIPREVSINEAVELAKKYGGAESPAFVNGVLDAISPRDPEPGSRK